MRLSNLLLLFLFLGLLSIPISIQAQQDTVNLVLTNFEYIKKGSIAKFTVTNETEGNITFNRCMYNRETRNNTQIPNGGVSFSIIIGNARGGATARLNGNQIKQPKNCIITLKPNESYTIEIPIISKLHERNKYFYDFTYFSVGIGFKYKMGNIQTTFSSSSGRVNLK